MPLDYFQASKPPYAIDAAGKPVPDLLEDPKRRPPNSGLQYSYGVQYRTVRGGYFLDPPKGLGFSWPCFAMPWAD